MELRPYQQVVFDDIQGTWASSSRQYVKLITGGGKTVIFSHVIRAHLPLKSLVVVHTDELIEQSVDKVGRVVGFRPDVEKAEQRASLDAQVVVTTVQTMSRRLGRWPKDHFGLIVWDETHRIMGKSFRKVVDHFGEARMLGVTATPERSDSQDIREILKVCSHSTSLAQGIWGGMCSPVTLKMVPLTIDISEVKIKGGDFDEAALGVAIEPLLASLAQEIKVHGAGRRIVVFTPLIRTSEKFVEECLKAGIEARHIDGTSPDRKEILKGFKEGKFQLLSNALLLTEGWDDPGVDCVIVLRPTKHPGFLYQMIGRGLRLHPGKKDCLVLEFIWRTAKATADILDLFGVQPKMKARVRAGMVAGVQKELSGAIADAEERLKEELLEAARREAEQKESARRQKEEQDKLNAQWFAEREAKTREREAYENNGFGLMPHEITEALKADPYKGVGMPLSDWCRVQYKADQLHARIQELWLHASRRYPDRYAPSDAQKKILMRNRIDPSSVRYMSLASAIIGAIAERQGWGRKEAA